MGRDSFTARAVGGGAAVLLLLALPVAARAQLQSASASALGMGDNYTALARGFNAPAWNPAGLGLPGGPAFSLALPVIRVDAGIDPITLADLKDYEGAVIPDPVKSDWLRRIADAGGQTGFAGGGVTAALSVGPVAVQLTTGLQGSVNLAPDGAELLLFGNAGRTGEPRSFSTTGSSFQAAWTTSVGVSYGLGFGGPTAGGGTRHLAVGATVKYIVGHLLIRGEDAGSVLSDDPLSISIRFPVVQTDTAGEEFNNGTGIGLDLGFALQQGPWTVGATVRNVVNTFEWDREKLFYRPGEALFDADTSTSDFDAVPLSRAGAGAAAFLDDLKFKPVLAVGASYAAGSRVTVVGEFRQRFGDGMEVGPKTHLGAGAEIRLIPVLNFRAGAAFITDGFELAGGLGLHAGPLNVAVAAARRTGDVGEGAVATLGITFGTR